MHHSQPQTAPALSSASIFSFSGTLLERRKASSNML